MFNMKTLLVLGAGASTDIGLPTGNQLRSIIANKLAFQLNAFQEDIEPGCGDLAIWSAITEYSRTKNEARDKFLSASRRIRNGVFLSTSIDDFLDSNSGDESISTLGKVAIVSSILDCEKESALYFDNLRQNSNFDFSRIGDRWYTKFFNMISKGSNLDQLFSNISIVSFNYDRSIEHFLFNAVRELYALPHQEAQKVIDKLRIVHPYGTVGTLANQFADHGISYGNAGFRTSRDLFKIAQEIRTYTEQLEDNRVLNEIKEAVSWAERLIIIGFGFHEQNMRILDPVSKVNRLVYATAQGISGTDMGVVHNQITSHGLGLSGDITIRNDHITIRNDLSCSTIFDEYWKTFSHP